MLSRKQAFVWLVIVIGTVSILFCKLHQKIKPTSLVVGILQSGPLPGHDQAKQGIIEYLQNKIGASNVSFIIRSAEISPAIAAMMAYCFHADRSIDVICTIGTLATQAMINVEKQRPIVASMVANLQDLIHPEDRDNISGVSGLIDVQETVSMLQTLLPHVHRVALLFNPNTLGRSAVAYEIEKELTKQNIVCFHAGVNHLAHIPAAARVALRNADAILLPADNTIMGGIPRIAAMALKANKPMMVCRASDIQEGVLIAGGGLGCKKIGNMAGKIAFNVAVRHRPSEHYHYIRTTHNHELFYIHKKTAQRLGITVPEGLEHKIRWVED